jgi:hypothetical protein
MIHWIIADISRSASKEHLSAKTGEPAWCLALEQKYARAGEFTLLSWPNSGQRRVSGTGTRSVSREGHCLLPLKSLGAVGAWRGRRCSWEHGGFIGI